MADAIDCNVLVVVENEIFTLKYDSYIGKNYSNSNTNGAIDTCATCS